MSGELEKRKLEEYEMQLFDFHSRAVYQTIHYLVHEKIQSNCKKLCETLKQHKSDPERLANVKAVEQNLINKYSSHAASHLKTVENIVQKQISVPCNILAEEDKQQKIQYSDEEYERLKLKLESLQKRAKQAVIMNAALKEELQILDGLSAYPDNVNALSNAIDEASESLDTSVDAMKSIENYNELCTSYDLLPESPKTRYNNIDELK